MIRARSAVVSALLLASATMIGTATPASGTPTPPPTGSIILRGQPAWSTPGDDVPFRLAIRAPRPGLVVQVVVHSAVLSRIAFERTLTGDRLGSQIASRSMPIDAMAVVGSDRVFTLGLQDPEKPREQGRVALGSTSTGVFPVEIDLRDPDSNQVLDSFVTQLVTVRRRALDEVPNEPLQVAWVWRVAAPPATTPSGTTSSAFTDAIEPNGRLGRIATGLGQVGDVPITLVPNPETVDALRSATPTNPRAASVLAALRTASSASRVLASPYTTIDGPAVLGANLGPAFGTAIALGRTTLESGLATVPDATITASAPLDAATLRRLRSDGGATRLIVAPESLAPADSFDQFTPARPFQLDTEAGPFEAIEVNALVTNLLVQSGPAALRAQQLLAGLSVIALEQPNRTRGVVVDSPLLWNPDTQRVAAVLAGLRDHPLLQGAALAELFGAIQPATTTRSPYIRTLAPIPPTDAPVSVLRYSKGRREIDALAGMIGVQDPLVVQLRHQLDLTLAGRVPGTGPAVSKARLHTIDAAVAAVAAGIQPLANRTVTLTSRKASVPLSITNASSRAITVKVTLESQKLEFPNGASRQIRIEPGNKTTNFDVAARASGTFPVLVTLASPDDGVQLQRARYTLRSSAVSGVGLVLTVGAGVFLAAWWLTHWRRSRRAPVATGSSTFSPSPGSSPAP